MTSDDATDVRAALARVRDDATARAASLDEALAGLRAGRERDTADDEHDPEGATLSAEWSRLEGLHQDALRERDAADVALRRVDAPGFGCCADCGCRIPNERLVARPTATRCVACAQKAGE
ncbi:TraR/DksA family transcriptional regulator [Microbacterium koreense]|uniref:TraR/DksA family transcriptional regulator n=1 Tax=Microbacterium koreense TaxID=323761 RepID=A0ABW2ZT63_9MICO